MKLAIDERIAAHPVHHDDVRPAALSSFLDTLAYSARRAGCTCNNCGFPAPQSRNLLQSVPGANRYAGYVVLASRPSPS